MTGGLEFTGKVKKTRSIRAENIVSAKAWRREMIRGFRGCLWLDEPSRIWEVQLGMSPVLAYLTFHGR